MKSQKKRQKEMKHKNFPNMIKKKIKPEIQQSPGNPSNINTKKIIDKHG